MLVAFDKYALLACALDVNLLETWRKRIAYPILYNVKKNIRNVKLTKKLKVTLLYRIFYFKKITKLKKKNVLEVKRKKLCIVLQRR